MSDPGYKLVQAAIEAGSGHADPGPSAVMTALVAAGLPTDRFFFEGFLPEKAGARRNRLEALIQVPGTLVLFESPHRLPEMLADAAAVLGRPSGRGGPGTDQVLRDDPARHAGLAERAVRGGGRAEGRDRRADRRGEAPERRPRATPPWTG